MRLDGPVPCDAQRHDQGHDPIDPLPALLLRRLPVVGGVRHSSLFEVGSPPAANDVGTSLLKKAAIPKRHSDNARRMAPSSAS